MREDRRSEPGLANGRVEAGRMQESIQALGPQSNPMLFVRFDGGIGMTTSGQMLQFFKNPATASTIAGTTVLSPLYSN